MNDELFAVNHPWNPGGNVIPPEVKRPGMESHRFDLLEFRHNGFESRLQEIEHEQSEHLVCHDLRLESIEKQLNAVQAWLNLECQPNPEGHFILDGSLPGVIADSGIMAINHCQESAAALVTVAVSATDRRADAICKQMDLLQNLLSSVKELVLNVDARLAELESRNPA